MLRTTAAVHNKVGKGTGDGKKSVSVADFLNNSVKLCTFECKENDNEPSDRFFRRIALCVRQRYRIIYGTFFAAAF